jgi:hypothetical protein
MKGPDLVITLVVTGGRGLPNHCAWWVCAAFDLEQIFAALHKKLLAPILAAPVRLRHRQSSPGAVCWACRTHAMEQFCAEYVIQLQYTVYLYSICAAFDVRTPYGNDA